MQGLIDGFISVFIAFEDLFLFLLFPPQIVFLLSRERY